MEDIVVSIRSNLLQIITRWEQSGQSEGGMLDIQGEMEATEGPAANHNHDDGNSFAMASQHASAADEVSHREDSIGCLSGRSSRALQSRASFLNGRPSYLLYFSEVADRHQILQSSLQRLSNRAGAKDAPSVPSTVSNSSGGGRAQQQRPQQQEQYIADGSLLTPLVESIKELVQSQQEMELNQAKDWIHELQSEEQQQLTQGNEQIRERAFRRRAELMDLARKYRKLKAELNLSDERSRQLSESISRKVVISKTQSVSSTFWNCCALCKQRS